jgi:transposase
MSKSIIVGADVSKGYADFFAVDSDRKVVVELFQLDDNKAGHAKLSEQFNLLKKTHRPDRIVFAVESSGGLEDNWLRTVKGSAFVEGYRLNPKVIHHEYRVQHRNSISDQISCMTIAHHVAKNLDQYEPDKRMVDPAFTPARNLIRHIVSLEQDCTGHKNSLQQILYQYLPSLLPLLPKGWSKYFLTILAEYGSKQSIQRAAAQGFKKISRVPKGKAQAIHEALRDGIDVKKTPPMVVSIIRSKALQILALKEEIASLEKVLCEMAPVAGKEVELLCSIRGMGPVAATILLCYIEDVHRFDDAKSMAAFFGVQPRIKVSGDGKTKIGMSKQGSALVRYTLYLLAFRTLSGEPYLRSIYAKFRRQGMGHDAALGVLMHKLIRTIFGMLKSGTAFDPGVDQLNQIDSRGKEDSSDPEQPAKEDPKRRFQPRTQDAPLSSRQRRQRKKGQESQAATGAESAGST